MTGTLTLFNFEDLRKDLDELSVKRTSAMNMRNILGFLSYTGAIRQARRDINDVDREVDVIIERINRTYGVEFDFSGRVTTAGEPQ